MIAAHLARLHAAAMPNHRAWSADEYAALIAHESAIFAYGPEGFVLGQIAAEELEILMVATLPQARRKGRACHAMTKIHQQAQAKGAQCAFLEVSAENTPAQNLYRKLGYQHIATRPRYYRSACNHKIDALVFRYDLAQSFVGA